MVHVNHVRQGSSLAMGPLASSAEEEMRHIKRKRRAPLLCRYVALACTVPDCRAPRLKRLYLLTALLSFAWVGFDAWFLLLWILKVSPHCRSRARPHRLVPFVVELSSLLRLLLPVFGLLCC